ncbi:MAG: hypothetical protein GYA02_11210, partial [Clostridiaceae bacterium]|nr:hypothetical protein [Clostridiaceae bacterium]
MLNQKILKQSMRNRRKLNLDITRIISILLAIVIAFQLSCLPGFQEVLAAEEEKQITLLFAHDMHDNFLPFKTEYNGKVVELGGYARLQSAINLEKRKDPELLLVNAGDYSM